MKKYLVIPLAAMLAFASPLAGQAVVGIYGGVNFADLGGSDVSNTEMHTGLNLGASVQFALGENFGVFLGGTYSEKGADVSEQDVDGTIELSYFEIPVLFRYAIPSSSSVAFHLYGGGALAFETGCEISGTDGSVSVSVDCDEVGLDTKSTDFGLVGGAGVDIGVSERVDLVIDLFYTLGLTSVDDSPEESDVKNRAITIRAGVAIPLG